MMYGKKKDPSCVYYGQIELPDDLEACAICGGDIWPGGAVGLDENNQICHAECVEERAEL